MTSCRSLLIRRRSRKISKNQGSELSSATIVPQDGVVADITRSKDKLYLFLCIAHCCYLLSLPVCRVLR